LKKRALPVKILDAMTGRPKVEVGTLRDLGRAADRYSVAARTRDEAIYRAHLAGNGLRVIALETGLSHETVRAIIGRVSRWVETEQSILAAGPGGLSIDSLKRDEANHSKRVQHLAWLLSVKDTDRTEEI
jgi:hypothetical protein